MSKVMDAIVIGCGASGIAALTKMHEAGLKVLGLEAADRIGGRICTVPFADNVVDLGAAWCHGEVDNIVYELAKPHGLLSNSTPYYRKYILSNGDIVPDVTADEMAYSVARNMDTAVKDSTSISDCLRNGLNSFNPEENPLVNSFIEWYERKNHLGGEVDPRDGKSMRDLEEHWVCEGDFNQHWKGRGFKTILDIMMKRLPNPEEELKIPLLLKKEVETIKWKANQAGLAPESPLVHITCKDGSLYTARRVVITVSIGVLKERNKHLFNPPLPQEKINTINNLQLCVLDKIYIEFEKSWWDKTPAIFSLLWRPEDKLKFALEEQWLTEIHGFLTIDNQPRVLLAWTYGEGAKIMEQISIENIKIGIEKLLKMVFEESYESSVKAVIRTQWASNALIRGAYSYRSVATEQNGGSAKILSEPLRLETGIPIVCFGGEATSYHRYGTVHGAIEAGFREGKRIIDSFK